MQQPPQLSSHQRHSTKRIKKRRRRRHGKEEQSKLWAACLILTSFALLFTLWIFTMMYYILPMMMENNDGAIDGGRVSSSSSSVQSAMFHNERQPPSNNTTTTIRQKQTPQSKLLSRNPNVIITSSTRGNLGPPSVLNQDPPGKDWLKDRWQAASDMHGTAIKGSHWVLFDFSQFLTEDEDSSNGMDRGGGGRRGIQMTKIVLDWETAFATDYRIEGRMDHPSSSSSNNKDEWCVLYDGGSGGHPNNNKNDRRHEKELRYGIEFYEEAYGQSPGVKQKLPLHIIHTIEWASSSSLSLTPNSKNGQSNSGESHLRGGGSCQTTTAFRYLRIFIRKPAHNGWGCSLWEVDVYGTIV